MKNTPTRQILAQLQENEATATALVQHLSDRQLNWQPNAGKAWSIAQCIDHVALANEQYISALLPAIARAPLTSRTDSRFAPGMFARYFIQSLEPPVHRRFSAPRKIQPASNIVGAEVMARFQRSHERVREAIAALQGKEANQIRFWNPLAPLVRVRAGTALLIILAHERRHLWQANNVSVILRSQL